jgi:hypothetical protein
LVRDCVAGVRYERDGVEKTRAQRMNAVSSPYGPEVSPSCVAGKTHEDDVITRRWSNDEM